MHLSVREHYAAAAFHHPKDLSLAERLVQEKYPRFCSAADQYLAGSVCYFGNMYIMRRPVFEDYCAWLFPILKEFDRLANTSEYSIQEQRVDGYLAERLFGIYYTYQKQQGNLRMLELPRVHFEPDRNLLQKKKLLAAILPPGTRRRAWIKRLFG